MAVRIPAIALVAALLAGPAPAQIAPETLGVKTLDAPGPHWFWTNDIAFFNMADARTYLLDADSGAMLGMLSTGIFYAKFEAPADYSMIYSPETYYSRHVRGERTDVVTFYDTKTLNVVDEVIMPTKRHSGLVNIGFSTLTDDDRFLVIYNFSPAQSVSLVDVRSHKFVTEIATPGCALAYAAGPSAFMMMCGDGSLMTIELDENGREAGRKRSDPFFDTQKDPVMEKAVRLEDTWYFPSFAGQIHPVDVSGRKPSFSETWSLTDGAQAGWRPGGVQLLAVHGKRRELAVLMHEGGPGSHKEPGAEAWVYDIGRHRRVRTIRLAAPAVSINVTQDEKPLLLASRGEPVIDVYDFESGEHLRSIEGVGQTPLYIQLP